MAQFKLIFAPESLADLGRINQFYTGIDPSITPKAFAQLYAALETIKKFPKIGRPHSDKNNIYEFLVPFGKGNFVIRYQPQKNTINILHIWHSLEDED